MKAGEGAKREQELTAERQVELLLETGLRLAGERDLEKAVQAATDAARELAGAQFGAFFYNVTEGEGESFMLYALSGVAREAFSQFPMPRNTAVFGPTFRGEAVVRSDDITMDPRYGHNSPYFGVPKGHPPVRSFLSTPVTSKSGEVLGGLFFGHEAAGVFSAEKEKLVVSIAAQAAVAIENSRLNAEQICGHQLTRDRLVLAQQNAGVVAWEFEPESGNIFWAEGGAEVFGVPFAELQTLPAFIERIAPEERARLKQLLARVTRRGEDEEEPFQAEFRIEWPHEEEQHDHWVEIRGRRASGESRLVIRGVTLDITGRKRAEQQLMAVAEHSQKQSQRVLEILESTTDAVFILDREWRFIYLNPHAVELIGAGQDLLGESVWEKFPEGRGSRFHREYRRTMNEGANAEFTEFYPPLDKWLDIRAYAVEEGIAVFFHDISTLKKTQRAVAESEQRLRVALEAGKLGTWRWVATTDALDLDERAAEIFGWQAHKPITRSAMRERAVVLEDRQLTVEHLRDAISNQQPYMAEYRITRADGSVGWVQSVGRPIFDEKRGRVLEMVGTVQEITERKAQEAALRQTEKLAATGRLAATIAHEINNPLEAVTNFIYLAKTNEELPETVRKNLELADQELARVSHIAQQTLGFYRDTSRPVTVDVNELVGDVAAVFQRKLEYKSLRLELDCKPNLKVLGLKGELRQVLSNLLVNAIDASETGGLITVRVRRSETIRQDGAVVVIAVSDQGGGIPEQTMKKIFTPFFTTKKEVGTGLGLWVIKGIVEKHDGTIKVKSRCGGAGSGTVFRVALPTRLTGLGSRG